MKILMVSTVKYATNGVSNLVKNMITSLNNDNYEVDLCFFEHSNKEQISKDFPNNQIWYLPNKSRNTNSYLSSLNKIMKNKEYDVLTCPWK